MFGPHFIPANRLTLYLTHHDCVGERIVDINYWIDEAAVLLTSIAGGATLIPAKGLWYIKKEGKLIKEDTTLIYCNVSPLQLAKDRHLVDDFIARYGLETMQETVTIEYMGKMYFESDFIARPRNAAIA